MMLDVLRKAMGKKLIAVLGVDSFLNKYLDKVEGDSDFASSTLCCY